MPESTKIDVRYFRLETLLVDMESKGIPRIPRFQRDYVWERSKVAVLFDSIYKEFPIGSFFFWITPREYRDLYKDIPELQLPTPADYEQIKMILDGQRRITSLYVAAKGLTIQANGKSEKDYKKICFDLDGECFAGNFIGTDFGIDQDLTNPTAFALEEHLEDFLVKNRAQTELGKEYDIYEEDGEKGQQYQTDTGPLDILAISKDKKRLLVVELKKGRASDAVVGQTLRYMSFVQEMLAEKDQTVHGIIIALEDDQRIRRAFGNGVEHRFCRYPINFKLIGA
jgi:hypothetical protein